MPTEQEKLQLIAEAAVGLTQLVVLSTQQKWAEAEDHCLRLADKFGELREPESPILVITKADASDPAWKCANCHGRYAASPLISPPPACPSCGFPLEEEIL